MKKHVLSALLALALLLIPFGAANAEFDPGLLDSLRGPESEYESAAAVFADGFQRLQDEFLPSSELPRASAENTGRRMYKVFNLYSDFHERYDGSFRSCVNYDDRFWEMPVYDADDNVITGQRATIGQSLETYDEWGWNINRDDPQTMKQIEGLAGKWHVYCTGVPMRNEVLALLADDDAIKELLTANGLTGPSSLELVAIPTYVAEVYFLFAVQGGQEYLIPFEKSDYYPIESEKVYLAGDVISMFREVDRVWQETIKDLPSSEWPIGGMDMTKLRVTIAPVVPAAPDKAALGTVWRVGIAAVGALVAAVAIAGTAYLIRRKKRGQGA